MGCWGRLTGGSGLYMSLLPEKSVDEDFLILLSDRVVPRHTVDASGKVLEVDIEAAWRELGLVAAWNNEVTVEVYMDW